MLLGRILRRCGRRTGLEASRLGWCVRGLTTGDQICQLQGLGKVIPGGKTLFADVNVALLYGAKIGVVGVNGTGKSSLLRILAGEDRDYTGDAWFRDGVQIKYLKQEPVIDESRTVYENVLLGIEEQTQLLQRFEEVSEKMGSEEAANDAEEMDRLLAEQADLQTAIEDRDCWNLERRVTTAMRALNLPPPDAPADVLSGGERRRIALCQLLLEAPDVLLLDEPTNHLDPDSVAWLETFLKEFRGTVVCVTHDRYFLDNVAEWIFELDRGHGYPFKGNYSAWLLSKQTRLLEEQKKETRLSKMLKQEIKWLRAHGHGSTARKDRSKSLQKQRDSVKAARARIASGFIKIPEPPRLGDRAMSVDRISMEFDGRTLFRDLSFTVEPNSIVGVIGRNGTGKSTLFRILAQDLEPSSGRVRVGSTVEMGVVAQMRNDLKDTNTPVREIGDDQEHVTIDGASVNVRAYLAAFNIKGQIQDRPVKLLSGGERNRLHLAKVLLERHNVLLLDEPTNDLDMDTMRSLEVAIREFPGCIMIISHDRCFLDRVCNQIIAFEGAGQGEDGSVRVYDGNYSEYRRQHRLQQLDS